MSVMKGQTLSAKEQSRLQVLNAVIAGQWRMAAPAQVNGVSVRHGWRLIAAYRNDGAASFAHQISISILLNADNREDICGVDGVRIETYSLCNPGHSV